MNQARLSSYFSVGQTSPTPKTDFITNSNLKLTYQGDDVKVQLRWSHKSQTLGCWRAPGHYQCDQPQKQSWNQSVATQRKIYTQLHIKQNRSVEKKGQKVMQSTVHTHVSLQRQRLTHGRSREASEGVVSPVLLVAASGSNTLVTCGLYTLMKDVPIPNITLSYVLSR